MRNLIISAALVASLLLAGCGTTAQTEKDFLTIDFQKGQTLRYRFLSNRNIGIEWAPAKQDQQTARPKVDKYAEELDIIVAYEPLKIDQFGLTTVKATFEQIKAIRTYSSANTFSRPEATESLANQSFTFTVGPTGKIEDNSQLQALLTKTVDDAYRKGGRQDAVKEPDLLEDVLAAQWFLWDPVATLPSQREGIKVGQSWISQLPIPSSMFIRKPRLVTYTISEIRPTNAGKLAVIKSSYTLGQTWPQNWPIIHTGRFQLAGPFGFFLTIFQGLNVLELAGQGEELFDIDRGRVQQRSQEYQLTLEPASVPLPGATPRITVKQSASMTLVEPEVAKLP